MTMTMMMRTLVSRWRRHKAALLALSAVAAFFAITGFAWLSVLGEDGGSSAEARPLAGWGQEALGDIRRHAAALSPIADANACGMGASSCFKCHSGGTRAAAPKMDPKSGAWHADHKSVNGSCVACHKGNARLVKKELAHEGLIKDSRQKIETCESCHKTGNTAELVNRYQR